MRWTVILTREDEPNPEDTYAAQCVELPGAISCGDGLDETIEMIKEAILCHLEGMVADGEPIPCGPTVVKIADLEDPSDYVITVEVPIPSWVAA